MRISQALREGTAALEARGIENPRLEAEVLLRHVLGLDRARLYVRLGEEIPDPQLCQFRQLLERRARREPVAYLVGHREFYGLDFLVDRRVLVPRPETELLVEEALRWLRQRSYPLVADVGTGSGAVAISIAVHCPQARVYAIDASPQALEVAAANRDRHGVREGVVTLQGDLLEPLPEPVDLVVANLPYIPSQEMENLEPEVREYEPVQALDGGPDGLEVIRRLLETAPGRLRPGGAVLLEIGADQGEAVARLASASFPHAHVAVLQDLARRDRVVRVAGV